MTATRTTATSTAAPPVQASVRACPACGAKNRTSADHLADAGRCGRCKAELPPVDYPLDVGGDEFAAITRGSRVPVLVDFWATWCPPCRMAAPVVKTVAKDLAGKLVVLKVDSDQNPALAARFGVQGIPNFVLLRGEQVIAQRPGFMPAPEMKRWLAAAGVT
ncbi:MAG TPA: thioredoxin family protein [Polyangia bacterium]|nr:thioredoxin family protein [Polyangia bacterium]